MKVKESDSIYIRLRWDDAFGLSDCAGPLSSRLGNWINPITAVANWMNPILAVSNWKNPIGENGR
jgi:hypothetical protein